MKAILSTLRLIFAAPPAALMLTFAALPAVADTAVPQFQVDPFWPKPLPNNWILGQVSGIATDRLDRIWVVHRPTTLNERERAAEQNPPTAKCCVAAPPVLLFDQSGNLLRSWGGPGQGYQWPESEHGIFVDDNDFVWLAGNGKKDGQLLKFTMEGKFVLQIGKPGEGNDSNATDRLGSPADVAVDVAAKEVFAADGYGNRRVAVFDSETGAYKRHWGAYGKPPIDAKLPAYDPDKPPAQQFGNPVHCIRLGRDGLIYVCDRTNNRLQVFRKDGIFVSEHVYEKATRGTGSVYDFVFSPDREQRLIYMIDGMNGEVRVIDRASKETLSRIGRFRPPSRHVHGAAQHRGGPRRQHLHGRGQHRAARAEIPPPRRAGLREFGPGLTSNRGAAERVGGPSPHVASDAFRRTSLLSRASRPWPSPACRSMRPTFSTSRSSDSSSLSRRRSGLSSISLAVFRSDRVAAVSSWRRIRFAFAVRSASTTLLTSSRISPGRITSLTPSSVTSMPLSAMRAPT
jgi:hypothetical protein